MHLIDTHSHLYSKQFKSDLNEVIQRAKENGVSKILLPNIDISSIPEMQELVVLEPEFFLPMMGLHPCSVNANSQQDLETIKHHLFNEPFIAVGEIGLDYYWDVTFFREQQDAFRTQVAWAKELKLPVAIHSRDAQKKNVIPVSAFNDIIEILNEMKDETLKGVFHCFTGNLEDAEKIIALGFYMGIGGVVTYPNAESLREAIRSVDLKHFILETDAPYLAPVPHRGKRNESGYVRLVAEKIAEIKGVDINEVAEITGRNAAELFALGQF